jgi:hypothetical protein
MKNGRKALSKSSRKNILTMQIDLPIAALISGASLAVGLFSRWVGNLLSDKKESLTHGLRIDQIQKEHEELKGRVKDLEKEVWKHN